MKNHKPQVQMKNHKPQVQALVNKALRLAEDGEMSDYDRGEAENRHAETMTEESMQEFLEDTLVDVEDVVRVNTFSAAGLMTRNKGLVVKMADGSEFQIQIAKSR